MVYNWWAGAKRTLFIVESSTIVIIVVVVLIVAASGTGLAPEMGIDRGSFVESTTTVDP